MAEQRLPIVDGDDGVWGDILRQYLMKEHYNDDTDNAANGGHQKITIRPGTAAAGTAPLKFTSGTLLTTPEAGAMEYAGNYFYLTANDGSRKKIATDADLSGHASDTTAHGATGAVVGTTNAQTLTNKTLTTPRIMQINDSNGNPALGFASVSSVANYLFVSNSATGGSVALLPAGPDANIDLRLRGKGTGQVMIYDGTDTTKRLKLDVSSIATSTTRTWAFPDDTSTFVGTDTTQTLTNKTLTSATLGGTIALTGPINYTPDTGHVLTFDGTPAITRHGGGTSKSMGVGADDTLFLGAGESRATMSTNITDGRETVEIGGDSGVNIHVSPDNWATGWAGRKTTAFTSTGITWDGNTVWHAGNDGSGSGLDADTLDGSHASAFASSSHTHTAANISDSTSVGRSVMTAASAAAARSAIGAGTGSGDVTLTGAQTLTNKTLDATNVITLTEGNFQLQDNGDSTKKAEFNISSGQSGGTTRVHTLPMVDSFLVGRDTTDTLTNKTIDGDDNTLTNIPTSAIAGLDTDFSKLVVTTATGNTGAENGPNTWAKIATWSPGASQHLECQLLLSVTNSISGAHDTAIVSVYFRTHSTDSNPSADVRILAKGGTGSGIVDDSFKIISGGWSSDMELWFKKGANWGRYNFYETSRDISGGTLTYATNPDWQSTTPIGAVGNYSSDGVHSGLPLTVNGTITGDRLISTVSNGTAPLSVSSTTKVTNLNADLLDDMNASSSATGDTIVARNSAGDIFVRYINMSHSAGTRNSDTVFFSSSDDYIRKNTAAGFKTSLSLENVDNTADAAKNVLSATKLTTARTIGGVSFDGTANINLPGVNTTGNQDTTGNADTATTATNLSGGTVNATIGDFSTVARTDEVRTRSGQQLVLNAGESHNQATGQTGEFVYINAESGLQINSSPDNWGSGWAARVTTTIDSSGITWNGNTVWHAGNDGAGSGLDADTLDGNQASAFASASHTHTAANISDSTSIGRDVLTAASAAAARSAIGAGTGNGNVTTTGAQTLTNKTINGGNNTLTNISADSLVDGTTNHVFTAADDSKLAGIEAGADVTDAANVNAAGAVMNSDTSTSAMNFVVDEDNMASNSATKVPTQQSTKAYVDSGLSGKANTTHTHTASQISDSTSVGRSVLTAASAAAARSAIGAGTGSGDVTLNGAQTLTNKTINGGDNILTNISADSLVDGSTYHVFTAADDSKLAGIEAGADVTDAANVNAAGAVMNSDTSTSAMNFVVDEDNMASNSATKVPTQQSTKAYVDNGLSGKANTTHTHTASQISDSTSVGRSVLTAASAAAARSAIGAGTGNGNVTTTGAQTLTNKTISGSSNTLSNISQSSVTNLTSDLASKANASHNHSASNITSGTLSEDRMPSGYKAVHIGTSPPGDTSAIWIDTN